MGEIEKATGEEFARRQAAGEPPFSDDEAANAEYARAQIELRGGRYAICVWDARGDMSGGTVVGPFSDYRDAIVRARAIRHAGERLKAADPRVEVAFLMPAEEPIDSILVGLWG